MITYEHFSISAPPATGVDWFVKGCDLLEMKRLSPPRDSAYTPAIAAGFSVSLVRHPLLWLVDFFKEMQGRRYGVKILDRFQEDARGCRGRFDLFAESVMKRDPTCISKVFGAYRADSVMKYDDFPWAAVEFWKSLIGDENPLLTCTGSSLENFGGEFQNRELRRDVVRHNIEFCRRYEYY